MPNTHITRIIIENEFWIVFIDGIVGQMHTEFIKISI